MDAGGWQDQINHIPFGVLDGSDITHKFTISAVYLLPVGRGRKFLGNPNRVVDAVIGGWELGSLYEWNSGAPWTIGGVRYLHNAAVPKHIENSVFIRAVAACADNWVQASDNSWSLQPYTAYSYPGSCSQSDFQALPPQYGENPNIEYTGIRQPSVQQFDVSLSKSFVIVENVKLQLRLEAFNAFNHPLWTGYDNGVFDSGFGAIYKPNGQSNVPRQVQIALKLLW